MHAVQHYFELGGWPMYLLAGVHLLAVVIATERTIVLGFARRRNRGIADSLAHWLRRTGDVGESLQIDGLMRSGLGRIAHAGLLQANGTLDGIRSAMEAERVTQLARLSVRTGTLKWFASLAVLLGLLGTIVAMVGPPMHTGDATSRAAALAAGIGESFHCTAYGLMVCVLAMGTYGLLHLQARRAAEEIDAGIARIVNAVTDVGPSLRLYGMRPPAEPRSYRS